MAFAVLEFKGFKLDLRRKHPPPSVFIGLRKHWKIIDNGPLFHTSLA